jgi:hypothetical protein
MTESSKINTAIAKAMGEVQKLPKDDRNEHGQSTNFLMRAGRFA